MRVYDVYTNGETANGKRQNFLQFYCKKYRNVMLTRSEKIM